MVDIRRFDKINNRLKLLLATSKEPIEIDENAYFDLLPEAEGDYNPIYIYTHFQAEEYFYDDLPIGIQIDKFYCGKYFKGEFPPYFECYEIFLDEYPRMLSVGFTCISCHVGPTYNKRLPSAFNCNYLYLHESEKYNQPIPETANIEWVFINKQFYDLPLPESYIVDENSNIDMDENIVAYRNINYVPDELVDEEENELDNFINEIDEEE